MPPKVLRIVNGEIKEVEVPADERTQQQQHQRRFVADGTNGADDDSDPGGDDDGPLTATEVAARRLAAATSTSSPPTFDFSQSPLAVSWEDRASSLAGLPGLSVFGAHLSSRWLVALAAAAAVSGLKGLVLSFAAWIFYKVGFESEQARNASGPHRLGQHPHSGALPAGALRAYLSAAGGARGGGDGTATTATASRGVTVAASACGKSTRNSSDDVRAATRKAWEAREAAVAAAAAEAKSKE